MSVGILEVIGGTAFSVRQMLSLAYPSMKRRWTILIMRRADVPWKPLMSEWYLFDMDAWNFDIQHKFSLSIYNLCKDIFRSNLNRIKWVEGALPRGWSEAVGFICRLSSLWGKTSNWKECLALNTCAFGLVKCVALYECVLYAFSKSGFTLMSYKFSIYMTKSGKEKEFLNPACQSWEFILKFITCIDKNLFHAIPMATLVRAGLNYYFSFTVL